METIFHGLTPLALAFAVAVTLAAGFVKGAVGFAMPMVMISGLASVMPPQVALATLIVPTLLSNVWQSLRGGPAAAWAAILRFRIYLVMVVVFILLSAQLVTVLPDRALFLILGVPVVLFAVAQLSGWRLRLRPQHRRRAEVIIGAIAGFIGGISGVWGPPTVAYLTALETPKAEQMNIQGVVYGSGGLMLFLAHIQSGVLNAQTAPLSVAALVPAFAGLAIGFRVSDRLDQAKFRRATLFVLAVAGLNLIRRGLMG